MSHTRLAVGVVSTRERADYMQKTLAALHDGEWIEPLVDQATSATANRLAAWQQLASQNATHALLLHDDLNASQGWRAAATALAGRYPRQQLTALYTPLAWSQIRQKDRYPGHFRLPIQRWAHDQAVMMPVPVVRRYLDWVAQKQYRRHLAPQQFLRHDTVLATFHRLAGAKVVHLAAPPVVQHMGSSEHQAPEWRGREFDAGGYYRHTLITA